MRAAMAMLLACGCGGFDLHVEVEGSSSVGRFTTIVIDRSFDDVAQARATPVSVTVATDAGTATFDLQPYVCGADPALGVLESERAHLVVTTNTDCPPLPSMPGTALILCVDSVTCVGSDDTKTRVP